MTSTAKEIVRYTRDDKEKFALMWILHGEASKAAAAMSIPRETGRNWMKKAWWPALVEMVRLRHKDQIEAKYENILDKTTDAIIDRLDNGDTVLVRGSERRVPVKAKELVAIMGTTQDKLRISRDQPTSIAVSATMDLRRMAANFARAGRVYQYTLHGKTDPKETEKIDKLPLFDAHGNEALDGIVPEDDPIELEFTEAESDISDVELDTEELDLDDDRDEGEGTNPSEPQQDGDLEVHSEVR